MPASAEKQSLEVLI